MKIFLIVLAVTLGSLYGVGLSAAEKPSKDTQKDEQTTKHKGMLHHVVAFKFKPDASKEQIDQVLSAFAELPKKIQQISSFEAGMNNSPEGLNKGFDHGWILGFKTEKDRDVYLNHAAHKAFVDIAKPVLEDVFVIDFWGGK